MSKMNIKARKGIIKISESMFEVGLEGRFQECDLLKAVFSEFYPLRIILEVNTIIYVGYSEHFSEISEGEIPPEYRVKITDHENELFVQFIK